MRGLVSAWQHHLGCSHPHDVDADQHIDGVIARDSLEHAKIRVIPSFFGDVIRKWHFVDTQRSLQGREGKTRHFSMVKMDPRARQE